MAVRSREGPRAAVRIESDRHDRAPRVTHATAARPAAGSSAVPARRSGAGATGEVALRCLPGSDERFGTRVQALVGDLLALPLDPGRIARIERAIRGAYPNAIIEPTATAAGGPVLRVERGDTPPVLPPPRGRHGPVAPATPRRILLVDPDEHRRAAIIRSVTVAGWAVDVELPTERILRRLQADPPDALILALDSEDGLGGELLRAVRDATDRPLIAIGGPDNLAIELLALECGADDFVSDERIAAVLTARLAAIGRRVAREQPGRVGWQGLIVDRDHHSVRWQGGVIRLTRTEFDLLVTLVTERGRVVPRADLLERVWGDAEVDPGVIEAAVHRLRQRFAEAGAIDPVVTVRGIGLRLADG